MYINFDIFTQMKQLKSIYLKYIVLCNGQPDMFMNSQSTQHHGCQHC